MSAPTEEMLKLAREWAEKHHDAVWLDYHPSMVTDLAALLTDEIRKARVSEHRRLCPACSLNITENYCPRVEELETKSRSLEGTT